MVLVEPQFGRKQNHLLLHTKTSGEKYDCKYAGYTDLVINNYGLLIPNLQYAVILPCNYSIGWCLGSIPLASENRNGYFQLALNLVSNNVTWCENLL